MKPINGYHPGGDAAAGHRPVVFGTQNARGVLPLSPCEERAGRGPERGETDEKHLLSPALSSFFEEERERKRGCALKANLLPNTTGLRSLRLAAASPAETRGNGFDSAINVLKHP